MIDSKSINLKKGMKFWAIKMNRAGKFRVVPCVYQETQRDQHYYKIPFEFEGRQEFTVSDERDEDIFVSRKEALVEAAKRCRDVAARWNQQADNLLIELSGVNRKKEK